MRNHPPLVLPVVYFSAAHLALLAAVVLLALRPGVVNGVLLAPPALAIVHLLALGWITLSIFGALHVVGPLALRMPAMNGVVDRVACLSTVLGVAALVCALLMQSFHGVAIAGVVLLGSFVVLSARVWTALAGSRAPTPIRAHVGLACGNLLLASAAGVLVAFGRGGASLVGGHLGAVHAHAHLAALGFGTLMFVGIAYRLLPMFLPAAPPPARRMWATAFLLEVGVLGLATSLWLHPPAVPVFAVVAATGLVVFFANLIGMLRHRKPPPTAMRRPDPGMLQALAALVYLLLAIVLGLFLAFSGPGRVAWMLLYGIFGLVGFLAQAILGVGMRLLPVFSWTAAWSASAHERLPPSPHQMPVRCLQLLCLGCWAVGVPLLAYGVARALPGATAAGAWLLLAGAVCGTISSARVLGHALASGR